MKYKLIGLLIFLAGWANAQIGIDLTEMIPAPDSGYMIITTGDEYPERGLQKYVKAADVLGLDTMFQQGDSLCLLFRHEDSYRCFPVHQAPRFEITDEGLRVCWEQRDTVWDTRAYLHFPGTAGSYVQARDVHDFEIGDQDAEIEIEWWVDSDATSNNAAFSTTSGDGVGAVGYQARMQSGNTVQTQIKYENFSASNAWTYGPVAERDEWYVLRVQWDHSEGTVSICVNGENCRSSIKGTGVVPNERALRLGMLGSYAPYALKGRIASFRFNDEYILFEESYGRDTLITNKGTVLDILGDVEWRLDTLGFTSIDTSHHCEIIPLTDTRLINVEHIGDSVRYTLSDSTIFMVRDSFIPQENIIGWIDDRIPDTVFFAKTSTATKAIEFGDTLELKGGAININIPVEIDYFPATNQLQVCWTEIELPEGGLQQKPGLGEEFGQQENETQQLPADTIRLCDTIQLNDVFIDTVIHDGSGWQFYRNDGKIWSVRDSFRTDDEILDLIEMMNDPQWLTLDRQGNEITIGITDGNEVSFELKDSLIGLNLFPISKNNIMSNAFADIDTFAPNFFEGRLWSTRYLDNDWILKYFEPSATYRVTGKVIIIEKPEGDVRPQYGVAAYTMRSNATNIRKLFGVNWSELDDYESGDTIFLDEIFTMSNDLAGLQLRLYGGSIDTPEGGVRMTTRWEDIKIERGTVATEWVPAIEDLKSDWDEDNNEMWSYIHNKPDVEAIENTLSIHDTRLLSLEYFRDTLGIPDIASFTHDGDSIHLTMNDGRSWTIPDLHFTEQEIKDLIAQESPVNHSWLLKDGGIPGNASDTVYRDGVAVIEGDAYDRYMTGDQDKYVWDGESGDPVLLQYVQDQSGNDMAAQGLAPNLYYAIVLLNSENPTEFEVIQLNLGNGIVFGNYGQGNRIGEPDYLLGVDQFGLIKEVRPTSGIDTIIHLGDSIYFDFDDKTFTIRDSVRSDAEIISLIEANRIFQQLGRSGDFITLTDGGQVLDLHLKNVTHTGDSIRFHLSDGRILSTRDSSLSVDAVRDMILEEIPETVFYVKQGDVTAPVNWGDVVELENGTVNVNMPTKVKMIDSLNALEVCIWQVVSVMKSDTSYRNYIELNGGDDYLTEPSASAAKFDYPARFDIMLYDLESISPIFLALPSSSQGSYIRYDNGQIKGNFQNTIHFDLEANIQENEYTTIEYVNERGRMRLYVNGEELGDRPLLNTPLNLTTSTHNIGWSSTNRLIGRIYRIQLGDHVFDLSEGSGSVIRSNKGTEFQINGGTWGVEQVVSIVESVDTFFQCDTILLNDIFIDTAYFSDDILTLHRNDGKLFEIEIQASGGDGIDTMYSTSDSLYIITSTGRTLSAGVSKGDQGDGLEYHWDGTRLGVRVENSGDPFVYVDLKGEKGDTGEDGREIELRVDSDIIQWRYVGDTWQTLIPLSALKGEKGDPGPGLEYHWDGTKLGVRKVGDSTYDYVDLKGEKGDPGDVVGDINIYKDDGVILEDRTAIIEEDNTLRFDLKEKAGFEIGHYSQDGNDSKFVHQRVSDESSSLEIQEIEKDTLWHSSILATPKGIGLRSHKAYESSHSYGTMGIDTSGSYILNLIKDNPGVLFAGRRQFLKRVSDDGHALWDTLGIQDVGITPADTARWGAGGGDDDYTLEMDGYQTHLRDGSGASKGFFQIGGTDGIEVYTEANNNRYRVGISNNFFPQWSLAFSTNNALQLRRDNVTQSSVGFVGTGGISIQSTAGSLTIDGSAIGGTQSLSFSPSLAQTTLSGGGGSFRIVGGTNTNVSLSSGGVYTISSTAAGDTREIVRGGTNNDWIMMSGSSVGVIDRYVSGFSKSGNNITLNRTDGLGGVTFSIADGDSDPTNELQTLSHNTSTQTTTLSHSGGSFRLVGGTGVNISNTSGGVYTISNSGDLVLKTEALNSGTATAAVIYASSTTGTITLPSGVPNGTVKYVINNSGGSKTINRGAGQTTTLNSSGAFGFIYYNIWWPMREP